MHNEKGLELYKGHIKEIEKSLQTNRFWAYENEYFPIFKRTERLATAVYILSGFLNVNDPLLWVVRKEAISVLTFITSVPTMLAEKEPENVLEEGKAFVSKLLLTLETAVYIRAISTMNFSILRDEYLALLGSLRMYLEQKQRKNRENLLFPEELFGETIFPLKDSKKDKPYVSPLTSEKTSLANKTDDLYKGQKDIKDINDYKSHEEKDTYKTEKDNNNKNQEKEELFGFVRSENYQQDKDSRRKMILQLLRARGELNIKDISNVMIAWSEKTLQRELISLIQEGFVIRNGARRWSTYRLQEAPKA